MYTMYTFYRLYTMSTLYTMYTLYAIYKTYTLYTMCIHCIHCLQCIHCIRCIHLLRFGFIRFGLLRFGQPVRRFKTNQSQFASNTFQYFRWRAGSNWTCEPPGRFANLDRYGIVGSAWLFPALAAGGRGDLALKMLLTDTYPGLDILYASPGDHP